MITRLAPALDALLREALPEIFAGDPPAVELGVAREILELDPDNAGAAAGEPRAEERREELAFDAARPAGPYSLSTAPYPGPRRVYLATAGGRLALRPEEVRWHPQDDRTFSLALGPHRDPAAVTAVQVLYPVVGVFTRLEAVEKLAVELTVAAGGGDDALLARAEALTLALVALERQRLSAAGAASYEAGGYAAAVELKGLKAVAATGTAESRRLSLEAELEIKASRALRAGEGRPIERIRTPGGDADPERPVDVRIEVEA